MRNANYYAQILAGIDFMGTIDDEFRKDRRKVEGFKQYVRDANSGRHEEAYRQVVPMISTLAHRFITRHDPINVVGRRCHAVSDQFNRAWRASIADGPMWLLLTVGEVRYKGDSVYDITFEKVKRCVSRGVRPDETLDVHVWLTLEDMTIFDLTIMASLLRLGWVTPEAYASLPIVIGKPDELLDFEYTPFLVDNDFSAKVGA